MLRTDNLQNSQASRKSFGLLDAVLIVLLIAVSIIMTIKLNNVSDDNLAITVKKNSEIVYSVDLSSVTAPYELCVDDEFNIVIKVEPDGVAVLKSDCVDKICVNSGKLTKGGQSVVCLPARVTVELTGSQSEKLDGVVG